MTVCLEVMEKGFPDDIGEGTLPHDGKLFQIFQNGDVFCE